MFLETEVLYTVFIFGHNVELELILLFLATPGNFAATLNVPRYVKNDQNSPLCLRNE